MTGTPKFDISGRTFGRLTARAYVGGGRWSCRCQCGADAVVAARKLRSGHTRSCGCLVRERATRMNRRQKSVTMCDWGDYVFTDLTKGYVTFVSPEDRHVLIATSWCANVKGGRRAVEAVSGRGQRLHRVICQVSGPREIVDHANGNRLDNRRSNLRICESAQNSHNQRSHGDSFYSHFKGVTLDRRAKTNPWVARITVRGETHNLGLFATAEEAADAYDAAAVVFHGEFALTNAMLGLR